MKKFLTAALALVLLLTLAACGGREGKEDPSAAPPSTALARSRVWWMPAPSPSPWRR